MPRQGVRIRVKLKGHFKDMTDAVATMSGSEALVCTGDGQMSAVESWLTPTLPQHLLLRYEFAAPEV